MDSAKEKDGTQVQNNNFGKFKAFTLSLLKGIMIVFKTKGPQIRCIPHGSFGLSQCKSNSQKTCWLTKSLKRQKQIRKKKGPQIRCIPHGR